MTFWIKKKNPTNPWQSWAIISRWNSNFINTIILGKLSLWACEDNLPPPVLKFQMIPLGINIQSTVRKTNSSPWKSSNCFIIYSWLHIFPTLMSFVYEKKSLTIEKRHWLGLTVKF